MNLSGLRVLTETSQVSLGYVKDHVHEMAQAFQKSAGVYVRVSADYANRVDPVSGNNYFYYVTFAYDAPLTNPEPALIDTHQRAASQALLSGLNVSQSEPIGFVPQNAHKYISWRPRSIIGEEHEGDQSLHADVVVLGTLAGLDSTIASFRGTLIGTLADRIQCGVLADFGYLPAGLTSLKWYRTEYENTLPTTTFSKRISCFSPDTGLTAEVEAEIDRFYSTIRDFALNFNLSETFQIMLPDGYTCRVPGAKITLGNLLFIDQGIMMSEDVKRSDPESSKPFGPRLKLRINYKSESGAAVTLTHTSRVIEPSTRVFAQPDTVTTSKDRKHGPIRPYDHQFHTMFGNPT